MTNLVGIFHFFQQVSIRHDFSNEKEERERKKRERERGEEKERRKKERKGEKKMSIRYD